jgi:hypothetical protein
MAKETEQMLVGFMCPRCPVRFPSREAYQAHTPCNRTEHRNDPDAGPYCVCGAQEVYYEDPDDRGRVGLGCELDGVYGGKR